jgi:FKBP-type peptidyl-prolyl cis-trans isomerase
MRRVKSLPDQKICVQVHDKVVGKGREIEKGTTATIGYVGKLDDGKVFDQGKYTFTFGRGQVIKGDDLGLQGMRVGGRRKLTIPPDLGYGSRGEWPAQERHP